MILSEALAEKLGVSINPEQLKLALTHRSYAYEFGGLPTNERLEFLGDSVMGLIITEELYERFPDLDRKSTRLNSSHVSESRMPSSA